MLHVTEDRFSIEVMGPEIPVLLSFGSRRCGSLCKYADLIVGDLEAEFDERMKVVKMDIDESPNVAALYNVRSVPTVLIFRNGDLIERFTDTAILTALTAAVRKRVGDPL